MPGLKGEPGQDGLGGTDGIPGMKGARGDMGPPGKEVQHYYNIIIIKYDHYTGCPTSEYY